MNFPEIIIESCDIFGSLAKLLINFKNLFFAARDLTMVELGGKEYYFSHSSIKVSRDFSPKYALY
jgi:hypothetical protein